MFYTPAAYIDLSTSKFLDFLELIDSRDTRDFKKAFNENPTLVEDYARDIVFHSFYQGKTDFFTFFLRNGLDPNIQINKTLEEVNKAEDLRESMLTYLARHKSIPEREKFIEILLTNRATNVNFVSDYHPEPRTALHIAIALDDDRLFQTLINHPNILLTGTSIHEESPISFAIRLKKMAYAKALLEKNPLVINDFELLSRLFENAPIVHNNAGEISKPEYHPEWYELIQKTCSSQENFLLLQSLENCLCKKVHLENPLVIQALINSQPFKNNNLSWHGFFIMMESSVKHDNINLLEFLIAKGVSSDIKDQSDCPALLHHANSIEVAKLLVTDSNINYLNFSDRTPLFEAVNSGKNIALINYLVNKGASLRFELLTRGNILYFLSSKNFNKNNKNLSFSDYVEKIFEIISNSGQDLKEFLNPDEYWSPLTYSCHNKDYILFEILLKKQESEGIMSLTGGKALEIAIEVESLRIVSRILSQKMSSNNLVPRKTLLEILNKSSSKDPKYLQLLEKAIAKFPISQLLHCETLDEFQKILDSKPELPDDEVLDLIHRLFQDGKTDFFAALLKAGLNPNLKLDVSSDPESFGKFLLTHLAHNTSIKARHVFIDILLNHPELNVNFVSIENYVPVTSLHIAINLGDDYLFEKLLTHKNINLQDCSYNGYENPLILAIRSKRANYAKMLIEKNLPLPRESRFLSDLFENAEIVAVSDGEIVQHQYSPEWKELIDMIITVLNFDLKERELLDFLSSPFNERFPLEDSLLMNTLLAPHNFDADDLSWVGFSAIMEVAAKQNNIKWLKFLKEKGVIFEEKSIHHLASVEAAELFVTAENINILDSSQRTPLFNAIIDNRSFSLINYLIDNGAILSYKSCNILHAFSHFKTFFYPTEHRLNNFATLLEEILHKISSLDINIEELFKEKNLQNETALESCFKKNYHNLFKILLKKENEQGIVSSNIEIILEDAIDQELIEIVSHILTQEKGSKNSVSKAFLLKIQDQAKNAPFYFRSRKSEKCMSLLNQAIKDFEKPIETQKTHKHPLITGETKSFRNSVDQGNDQKTEGKILIAPETSVVTINNDPKSKNINQAHPNQENGQKTEKETPVTVKNLIAILKSSTLTPANNVEPKTLTNDTKPKKEKADNILPKIEDTPDTLSAETDGSKTFIRRWFDAFRTLIDKIINKVTKFFSGKFTRAGETKNNKEQDGLKIVEPENTPYMQDEKDRVIKP